MDADEFLGELLPLADEEDVGDVDVEAAADLLLDDVALEDNCKSTLSHLMNGLNIVLLLFKSILSNSFALMLYLFFKFLLYFVI